jgi:hypothetical protein
MCVYSAICITERSRPVPCVCYAMLWRAMLSLCLEDPSTVCFCAVLHPVLCCVVPRRSAP